MSTSLISLCNIYSKILSISARIFDYVRTVVVKTSRELRLINGEKLVSLLMEHSIGVQRTTQYLFDIDDELFLSKSQNNS